MNLVIEPRRLSGTVTPPPSKSMAHRCLIAAALAEGESRVNNLADSDDMAATRRCLTALREHGEKMPLLDCGESGSTLRFLIPPALALREGGRFVGRGRLMERPQKPYFDIFAEKGIVWTRENGMLTIRGRLEAGEYTLPGNVSSQFITGLLFALPLLDGESKIRVTTPLESKGYVDLTLDVLERFGIRVENREYQTFIVPGQQKYQPETVTVEADWSQAAFWYAANALGSAVEIDGLNAFSNQGDMAVVPAFLKLTCPGDVELDVSQCPDLVPPLAAMAAVRSGTTKIVNAARLRIKESDRLASVTATLNAMGARVEEHPDSLTIQGLDGLEGGVALDCCNDHRIAMMAAIAATRSRKPVTLLGAECVNKSYPDFWDHYRMLGGSACVLVSG